MQATAGQSIAFDSDFGAGTRQALVNAQTWEAAQGDNISIDGVYGPETRDAMLWPYRNAATKQFVGCMDI